MSSAGSPTSHPSIHQGIDHDHFGWIIPRFFYATAVTTDYPAGRNDGIWENVFFIDTPLSLSPISC